MIRRNAIAPAAGTTFGARMGMIQAAESAREDSQVWLNVGYMTGDPEYPIVTLPYGIPVDTQKPLALPRGKNEKFFAFVLHRNGLLEQIQKAAADLAPGEDIVIGGDEGGLVLQLRRREAERAAEEAPAVGYFPAFELKIAS